MYNLPSGPPPISDEDLALWDSLLDPLLSTADGIFTTPHPADLRCDAFYWDVNRIAKVQITNILDTFITVHDFGTPAFFKPSIAEVFAQIDGAKSKMQYYESTRLSGIKSGFLVRHLGFHSVRQRDRNNPDPNVVAGDWHTAMCLLVHYVEVSNA